ncbi:186_t:CDS:2, partial [Acaulospora morrowiae]
ICDNIECKKGSDIYNLGIVLWEISNDNLNTLDHGVIRNSLKNTVSDISSNGKPHEYEKIYTDCWQIEHPNIEKVVEELSKLDFTTEINEHFTHHNETGNVLDSNRKITPSEVQATELD